MRGISKRIATEQDVINNMTIDKLATRELLIQMRDNRFAWVKVSHIPLPEKDAGITDATHRVTIEPQDGDVLNQLPGNICRYQWEYKEDKGSALFRAGLTVEKVNRYIDECSR